MLMVVVPATLPVWTPNWGTPKVACVPLGGMVKVALRPPVENWTAGSSTGFGPAGVNERLSVPVICTGKGAANDILTCGCCSGCMEPENPSIEMAGRFGTATTMLSTCVVEFFAASLT